MCDVCERACVCVCFKYFQQSTDSLLFITHGIFCIKPRLQLHRNRCVLNRMVRARNWLNVKHCTIYQFKCYPDSLLAFRTRSWIFTDPGTTPVVQGDGEVTGVFHITRGTGLTHWTSHMCCTSITSQGGEITVHVISLRLLIQAAKREKKNHISLTVCCYQDIWGIYDNYAIPQTS